MSDDALNDSVKWSCSAEDCSGLEECAALVKLMDSRKKDEAFLLGERANGLIQASGYGEGPYYCEVGFTDDQGKYTDWYAVPEEVSWDGLVALMRRFEGGEDFSFAKEQWQCSANAADAARDHRISKWGFIAAVVIFLIALVIILMR